MDDVVLGGYRVRPLLEATGREIVSDRVLALAASTAYYFFFSLFPILLFLTPLLSLVGDRQRTFDFLMLNIGSIVQSPEAFQPLRQAIHGVVFSEHAPELMSMGALLAAWSGSSIFGQLLDALNTAYDVKERRVWWRRQLLKLAMFVVATIIVALATAVILVGDQMAEWVGGLVGLDTAARRTWMVVQYPIVVGLLIVLTWSMYQFLPNVRQRKSHTMAAAILATLLWLLATLLFRVYVQNFASFNRTYGTIGGIIALLMWMYMSMLVVLAGGELAAELHHGTARVDPDQGAVYHGRIVTGENPGTTSLARAQEKR